MWILPGGLWSPPVTTPSTVIVTLQLVRAAHHAPQPSLTSLLPESATREGTFLHGSRQALLNHTERILQLEREDASRFPERTKADALRTREGSRTEAGQPTGREPLTSSGLPLGLVIAVIFPCHEVRDGRQENPAHNSATNGPQRAAETPVGTAVTARSMVRKGSPAILTATAP